VREDAVRVSKGGRELSRKEARVPIRWKAPRPFRGRYSSRGGVQRRSQAGCRSDGSLQPRRRGPVGNAGAREERRGGASANADPLLGPLGPRGVTLRKQPVRLAPEQHITWLAAGCLGNLTTRQREAAQSRICGRGRAVRKACPCVVSDCRSLWAALWSREAQALRISHEETRRLRGRGSRSQRTSQSRGNLWSGARRAKQRRQSDRGGKVAGSMKDGAEPEGAITCRWKALRVVDIV
jgi:hypothetical protein